MPRTDNTANIVLAFNADLDSLKKQLDILSKQLKDSARKNASDRKKLTVAEYDKMATEVIRIQQRIDDTKLKKEKALLANQTRLLNAELKRRSDIQKRWDDRRIANQKAANKRIEKDSLVSEKKKQAAIAAQQKKGVTGYISRWSRAFDTITRYISAAALVGVGLQGLRDIATDFLQIEQALYRVSVITGETIQESFKLRDTIYQVSTAFGIGAKEVSGFVFNMSKLGKSQEEISELAKGAGVLSSVLGEDMSASGQLIVTTMNQFHLVTSESNRVVTTFFNTIKKSPQTVKDLQTVLQYIGSAANATGISIEELGIMIADLSNKGLRSSKIGTGLRNVFLKLSKDGRDLKTVLSEMSREGITLSEALELFGKRGAIAGYNLINSWGEMQEKFLYDMPTSIEVTADALRATDSWIGRMTKSWEKLKSVITGADLDPTLVMLDDMRQTAELLGINIQYAGERIRQAIQDGETVDNWLEYILSEEDLKKLQEDTKHTSSVMSQLADNLTKDIITYKNKIQSEITRRSDITEEESIFTAITQSYKQDIIKGNKTIDEVRELLEGSEKTLSQAFLVAGLSVKESNEKAKKVINDQIASLAGVERDKFFSELEKDFEDTDKKIAEIIKKFESGRISKREFGEARDDLVEKRKDLCALFKGTELEYLCVVGKETVNKELSRVLKEYDDIYKNTLTTVAQISAKAELEQLSVSETKSSAFKELLTFKQWSVDNFDADKTTQELAKEWGEQTKSTLVAIANEIIDTATDEEERIRNDAKNKALTEQSAIDSLMDLIIGGDLNEAETARIKSRIEFHERNLDKINTDILKKVDSVWESANKAQDDIEKKDRSITSLVNALILGADEDDKQSAEEKLKKTLSRISNLLSEVATIYKSWSDEMFNQLDSRLNAEKESIGNRYNFEKDQLRLAAENNLITQEQYSKRSLQLEKKRLTETNRIAKQQFDAKKKQDYKNAIIDANVKAAQVFTTTFAQYGFPVGAILGGIGSAIALASGLVAANAINKRQYSPVTFAEGGLVKGKSHAQGGVPFTVQGQSGYEMEGNEFIVKKESVTPQTLPLLEAINNDSRYNSRYFATGGSVPKDDADAKTTTVVRAYITQKDLDAYERNRPTRTAAKSMF